MAAYREAVRLLDCLLASASPGPKHRGFGFTAILVAPAFDRLATWLASRPDLAAISPCPMAAAQREAVRLLPALMARVETIRPLPSGAVECRFACGAVLFDRLMVWGAAVEDMEVWGEDDEDGADAEPPDYPPDGLVVEVYVGAPKSVAA
jgi:hypothetical protein